MTGRQSSAPEWRSAAPAATVHWPQVLRSVGARRPEAAPMDWALACLMVGSPPALRVRLLPALARLLQALPAVRWPQALPVVCLPLAPPL